MKTVALIGAGGKMGARLSKNLKDSKFRVLHVENSQVAKTNLEKEQSVTCVELNDAIKDADIVLMATPDALIGKILGSFIDKLKPDTMIIMLDAAAPYAGTLPKRDDITYFVTHPCHPPLFTEEIDEKGHGDYFGGIRAKQHIVCALMQGKEEHYDTCELVARTIYKPVMRSHRITVEQMAILEPALSETVGATLSFALREATDKAIEKGVPKQAAFDFVLGHLNIELALAFEMFDGKFSDGAIFAINEAKPVIFKENWVDKVFDDDAIKESVKNIASTD